jgi:hypothetical protein
MLIMHLVASQTVHLLDASQRLLGRVIVERSSDDLITGTFQPGPGYPVAGDLFRRFEEAANSQALSVVEEIESAIAALGLSLSVPDGSQRQAIRDVQIWSDGGFSCRPGAAVGGSMNGPAAVQSKSKSRPS